MTKKTSKTTAAMQPLRRIQKEGERLYERLRKDAEALLSRGRKEIADDVRLLQRRAEGATRTLEASLLKRLHAASERQVRRLERRVEVLEQQFATLQRAETARSGREAAA